MVSLNPDKYINFIAGQFAFFSLNSDVRDEHPFSILDQNGSKIRMGVKTIGKFTANLSQLKPGAIVSVFGPFGTFSSPMINAKKMLWISGGIGITPFYSMVKQIQSHQEVIMVHSSGEGESQLFVNMFKNLSTLVPNFKFFVHDSNTLGRLNDLNITKYSGLSPDIFVFLCGPKMMMESFLQKLPDRSILQKKIIFEDFDLK